MDSPCTPITCFFESFQRNSAAPTEGVILTQFAPTFLAAGPDGARAVPATAFTPALVERKQLFQQLGCRSTELVSVEDIPLDDRYSLARSRWRMTFTRPGYPDEEIVVDSTFLIDLQIQQILVYLAHQDIFSILRQRDILRD